MAGYRPQRKYIAVLAGLSAGILILGYQFKPTKVLEAPTSQSDLIRLQLTSQRRNLEDLTSYFSRVAEDVKPNLVWIRGLDATGVIWSDRGEIITAAPRKPLPQTLTVGSQRVTGDVATMQYPVTTLKAPAGVDYPAVFRGSAEALPQGSWIIQVGAKRDGGHLYAPGTLKGVVAVQCGEYTVQAVETNLPLEASAAGGGVFDLSRNLLGVILRCGGSYQAVTPESVERILGEARSFEGRLLMRYGLRAEALTDESSEHFGTDRGLLVTEVWSGWPAGDAGLVPGDILQALDKAEVNAADDLAQLLAPAAYLTFDWRIWRNGRSETLTMPAAGQRQPETGPGIFLRSADEGYLIEEVSPGSSAEAAMIEPGDRLMLVDGVRPRNVAQASRVLSDGRDGIVYVVVQRGQRRFGAYLR